MSTTETDHPRHATPAPGAAPVRTLHLASRSPRRRKLLEERGVVHEAEAPGVDDTGLVSGRVGTREWAAALAHLKAAAAARRLRETGVTGRLVLGADTIVVKGDLLIGQPRDGEDAARILRLLEDGEHLVVTGVTLIDLGETADAEPTRELFADTARVRVGKIGAERIDPYVASGEWRGKAGAYNLEERVLEGWPIAHEGDAATVMGLPMERLLRRLAKWRLVAPAAVGAAP